MDFIALDIETAKPFPEGSNWQDHSPLGVACAVTTTNEPDATIVWASKSPDGSPADLMTRQDIRAMLAYLEAQSRRRKIVTWNGLGFDWQVLAQESGDMETCQKLALAHIDMMYQLFCMKGFPLALGTAARGMNVGAKSEGIAGNSAPHMWQAGQRQKVIDYCIQDTVLTLAVANAIQDARALHWIARSGRPNTLFLPQGLLNVKRAQQLPEPDTDWMDEPMHRSNFDAWLV